MKGWTSRLLVIVAAASIAGCAAWKRKAEPAVETSSPPPESAPAHTMLTPAAIQWKPFPPGGPGARWAVLAGDPEKPGPFVIRIRQPAGAKVPPHWHPSDENVTVVRGTIFLGMGEKVERRSARELSAGSYAFLPRKQPHYALVSRRGEAIVQVHGTGPFQVVYVNPADDPRNKTGKRRCETGAR